MSKPSQIPTFCIPGRLLVTYQFGVLPFGLNTAPMVWTKVLAPIMEILHLRGIYISPYLHDFITKAAERIALSQALDHSTEVLLNSGFVINIKSPRWCQLKSVCRRPIPYRLWSCNSARRTLTCSSKSAGSIPTRSIGHGTCVPASTRPHCKTSYRGPGFTCVHFRLT